MTLKTNQTQESSFEYKRIFAQLPQDCFIKRVMATQADEDYIKWNKKEEMFENGPRKGCTVKKVEI